MSRNNSDTSNSPVVVSCAAHGEVLLFQNGERKERYFRRTTMRFLTVLHYILHNRFTYHSIYITLLQPSMSIVLKDFVAIGRSLLSRKVLKLCSESCFKRYYGRYASNLEITISRV